MIIIILFSASVYRCMYTYMHKCICVCTRIHLLDYANQMYVYILCTYFIYNWFHVRLSLSGIHSANVNYNVVYSIAKLHQVILFTIIKIFTIGQCILLPRQNPIIFNSWIWFKDLDLYTGTVITSHRITNIWRFCNPISNNNTQIIIYTYI